MGSEQFASHLKLHSNLSSAACRSTILLTIICLQTFLSDFHDKILESVRSTTTTRGKSKQEDRVSTAHLRFRVTLSPPV